MYQHLDNMLETKCKLKKRNRTFTLYFVICTPYGFELLHIAFLMAKKLKGDHIGSLLGTQSFRSVYLMILCKTLIRLRKGKSLLVLIH